MEVSLKTLKFQNKVYSNKKEIIVVKRFYKILENLFIDYIVDIVKILIDRPHDP